MNLLLSDGKRIKHLRETRKHYSQAGLAATARCSIGTIMRVEKGMATSPGTLERIAKALDVNLIDITATGNCARLLSSPQLASVFDRILPYEDRDTATGKRGRLLPMDERGHGVLSLLVSLGLVKIGERGPQAASDLAVAFLASLRAHLHDENAQYFGRWSAGPTTPAGRKLAAIIRSCEEHRIQNKRTPAREVRAALGLIRAEQNGKPRFLMLQEPTWNPEGAWWFVGGLEKACDGGNLAKTMLREIREELALDDDDQVEVNSLNSVTDERISGRLGVFTRYQYEVFQVKAENCLALKKLLLTQPSFEVQAPTNPSFTRIQRFRWFSWGELLRLDHLAKHAPPVLDLLRTVDSRRLPSIGRIVEK